MSYFNSEQESYIRSLAEMPPEAKCYCGWYPVGKCEGHDPRCREGKSAADKMQERASLAKEKP